MVFDHELFSCKKGREVFLILFVCCSIALFFWICRYLVFFHSLFFRRSWGLPGAEKCPVGSDCRILIDDSIVSVFPVGWKCLFLAARGLLAAAPLLTAGTHHLRYRRPFLPVVQPLQASHDHLVPMV